MMDIKTHTHTRIEQCWIGKVDIYLERQLLANIRHRITTTTVAMGKLNKIWDCRSVSFEAKFKTNQKEKNKIREFIKDNLKK